MRKTSSGLLLFVLALAVSGERYAATLQVTGPLYDQVACQVRVIWLEAGVKGAFLVYDSSGQRLMGRRYYDRTADPMGNWTKDVRGEECGRFNSIARPTPYDLRAGQTESDAPFEVMGIIPPETVRSFLAVRWKADGGNITVWASRDRLLQRIRVVSTSDKLTAEEVQLATPPLGKGCFEDKRCDGAPEAKMTLYKWFGGNDTQLLDRNSANAVGEISYLYRYIRYPRGMVGRYQNVLVDQRYREYNRCDPIGHGDWKCSRYTYWSSLGVGSSTCNSTFPSVMWFSTTGPGREITWSDRNVVFKQLPLELIHDRFLKQILPLNGNSPSNLSEYYPALGLALEKAFDVL